MIRIPVATMASLCVSYHREPPRFRRPRSVTVSAWQHISLVLECPSRLHNTVACLLEYPEYLHLRPIRVVNGGASHAMVIQMTKRTVATKGLHMRL